MDFSKLSRSELDAALRDLQAPRARGKGAVTPLSQLAHESEVLRCELEIRTRQLREKQQELDNFPLCYAELYDSLPIGYVTLSAEGKITEANLAAGDLLGLQRKKLPGLYLRQFIAGADAEKFAAYLAETIGSGERVVFDTTLEPRETTALPVQLSSRRAQAGLVGESVIRVAITDVSRVKEALHVLQEVVAEQESFAYSISHDLRAPLLTISSFSTLLAEESGDFNREQTHEVIGRIRRAALRMDELLLNLLEYTRVSRSNVPLEPLSVTEVVNDVLLQYQGAVNERNARISVQEPLPAAVGSRALLSQVLGNLLTNALKYTPKDRPPVIRITGRQKERTVVITVADEGIGIAAQHHERVFRIFERLHGVSAYPGTGIGLALVRRAADRMHGRVWVESEEAGGSRFHLELPRAPAA